MGKIKNLNKTAQDCSEQMLSSASQSNFNFDVRKSNSSRSNKKSTAADVNIRRTGRVHRTKPNYYDSLDYEKLKKERRQRPNSKLPLPHSQRTRKAKDAHECFKTKRMHLKTKKKRRKKPEESKEEDLEEITLSEETLAKFSMILDEINRKICASSWRV